MHSAYSVYSDSKTNSMERTWGNGKKEKRNKNENEKKNYSQINRKRAMTINIFIDMHFICDHGYWESKSPGTMG